jgi:hypothetical protein
MVVRRLFNICNHEESASSTIILCLLRYQSLARQDGPVTTDGDVESNRLGLKGQNNPAEGKWGIEANASPWAQQSHFEVTLEG